MNAEFIEALDQIEKDKGISKEVLIEAIETSLVTACKNHYGSAHNIKVEIDRIDGDVAVYAEKEIVEVIEEEQLQITLEDARKLNPRYNMGDIINIEITPKNFGRIAAQKAKQVVVQKIREEERKVLFNQYCEKEKDITTGIVQRRVGKNVIINLGKVDAVLQETEQVRTEQYNSLERYKVYVLEVKDTTKGPKVLLSRTHPELVKRLFEMEVPELEHGIVEIRSISREAGSRTKISVMSNDKEVDAVGACVGQNGTRVGAVVTELRGEKIDIVDWDEDARIYIENALSPAKVVSVEVNEEEKTAKVIVPDYQLSLAIGKEGQNARLAARLTGYKIDIKSETQAGSIKFENETDIEYDEFEDFNGLEEVEDLK